jgi:hypothetical protein
MSNPALTGPGKVLTGSPTSAVSTESVPTSAVPTKAGAASGKSDLADAPVPGLVVAVLAFAAVGAFFHHRRGLALGRAAGLFVTSDYGTAAFSGLLFGALLAGLGWRQAGLWQITVLPVGAVVALAFVRTSGFNNAVRQSAH